MAKLYYATGGANWTGISNSWPEGDVCQYEVITCSADSVTKLNLAGFGLIAVIVVFQLYLNPVCGNRRI